ncbi:ABC transporter ATP-binding protein [Halomarina halobia]|uniref:ABC transporter ATP-binding protein n=1 Tax=Halomarina halobia TaxID=3033386 RepID=A0ABD6A7A6_9EURY|nr:ABC transporter ATP-binding protein [Halomarina sp. PSR21]
MFPTRLPGLLASAADDAPEEASKDASAAEGADEALLSVADCSVSYGKVSALRNADLRVDRGEFVALIGPNGAGKSTLANTVSGFLPYEGSVAYAGREVRECRPRDLVQDGLIHCTEKRDLFGFMSVEDNLELGAYRHGRDADERLAFVYDLFPALEERTEQEANTMSGGEQQMLAIGRALMGDPQLLVLDEPTLGLAPVVLQDISDGIDRIREEGVTVLLCEQNVTFALKHADRIYLLENGEVVREGTPDTLRGDDHVRESYLGG